MIDGPQLTPNQYAVLMTDASTGIVLTVNRSKYISSDQPVYTIFDGFAAAKIFIANKQKQQPELDFSFYNARYELVDFCRVPKFDTAAHAQEPSNKSALFIVPDSFYSASGIVFAVLESKSRKPEPSMLLTAETGHQWKIVRIDIGISKNKKSALEITVKENEWILCELEPIGELNKPPIASKLMELN